jgi:putative transposase
MIPLEPENFYHIYNRANGNENIFENEGNYHFFLSKYKTYISPLAHSYCYCLMPNHFHFLIKIKSEKEIRQHLQGCEPQHLQGFKNLAGITTEYLLSHQFSRLQNSYAKAFNKQQSRKGSLFMKNFKRKKIDETRYLRKLVHYIHYNPVDANLCTKPIDWKFSSYNSLLTNDKQTMLEKDEVLDWFENKENFIYCHNPKKFNRTSQIV